MKRRLFTLMSALSLLLCVAASAMWCRSHWREDGVYHTHHASPSNTLYTMRLFGFASTSGRITCLLGSMQIEGPDATSWENSFFNLKTAFPEGWRLNSSWPGLLPVSNSSIWNKIGFAAERAHMQDHLGSPDAALADTLWMVNDETHIMIPYWLIVVLTVLLPLNWLRLALKHRHPPGHCRTCGYDLRATPGRCPECGTVPAGRAQA